MHAGAACTTCRGGKEPTKAKRVQYTRTRLGERDPISAHVILTPCPNPDLHRCPAVGVGTEKRTTQPTSAHPIPVTQRQQTPPSPTNPTRPRAGDKTLPVSLLPAVAARLPVVLCLKTPPLPTEIALYNSQPNAWGPTQTATGDARFYPPKVWSANWRSGGR